MTDKIRWGLDNPHPFSQMKTELIWEGKYDEYGNRIRQDILKEKRAEYGKEIVVTLSRQLSSSHFVAILPLKDDL